VTVPADPKVWAKIGHFMPERAMLALHRAGMFYGFTRLIFWTSWAHIANGFEWNLSPGGVYRPRRNQSSRHEDNSQGNLMSDLNYFLYDQDGPIVTITFNRPEKRNGLDPQVMLEFESLIHRVRDANDVKVLVVTGKGSAFCAGADLTLARDAKDDDERRRINEDMGRVPRIIGRVFDVMVHMDVISIASVNGFAVGGGWSMATGFDHIIAVEDAQFWLPEVEIERPFKGLANINLTQRLGPVLAKEAMILCRRFSAEELRQLRVINQVCKADELESETRRIADAYLSMPWKAAISTRRDINATIYGPQYY
jgi:enoyl-CoA hydratase/carnithine racemase